MGVNKHTVADKKKVHVSVCCQSVPFAFPLRLPKPLARICAVGMNFSYIQPRSRRLHEWKPTEVKQLLKMSRNPINLAKLTFILACMQLIFVLKLFVHYVKADYDDTTRLSNSPLEKPRVSYEKQVQ